MIFEHHFEHGNLNPMLDTLNSLGTPNTKQGMLAHSSTQFKESLAFETSLRNGAQGDLSDLSQIFWLNLPKKLQQHSLKHTLCSVPFGAEKFHMLCLKNGTDQSVPDYFVPCMRCGVVCGCLWRGFTSSEKEFGAGGSKHLDE